MAFLKVAKTKAYYKRYQTKFKRRRQGKTDYRARKRLINQDKNKYNTPKTRFVVRITNRDVICQLVRAKIAGDEVICAAYAHELTRYGMPIGHANYASCYATGLLLARRWLKKINLDTKYEGQKESVGEDYQVEALEDGPRPFKALLDVGLRRTTTGSRVFAALKGAADGGLNIPHSETRFVGYDEEGDKLDAEVLRKHIFGGHVADWMKTLKTDNPESYKRQFSLYIKNGINPEDLEKKWAAVHTAIRKDPEAKKSTKPAPKEHKKTKLPKRTLAARKNRVRQRIAHRGVQAQKAAEETQS